MHLAIADDNDEYVGTVSLKDIVDGFAEFAICIRRKYMGSGMAKEAMKNILDIGFNEHGLSKIYWCVSAENKRALRFYDKNGYKRIAMTSNKRLCIHAINSGYNEAEIASYIWYMTEK